MIDMHNRFETLEPRRVRHIDVIDLDLPPDAGFNRVLQRCSSLEIAVYRIGLTWRLKGGPGKIDMTVLDLASVPLEHLYGTKGVH